VEQITAKCIEASFPLIEACLEVGIHGDDVVEKKLGEILGKVVTGSDTRC
jgi:hypothetical protein